MIEIEYHGLHHYDKDEIERGVGAASPSADTPAFSLGYVRYERGPTATIGISGPENASEMSSSSADGLETALQNKLAAGVEQKDSVQDV